MPGRDKLSEFVAWCGKNITGDEIPQMLVPLFAEDNNLLPKYFVERLNNVCCNLINISVGNAYCAVA